mmetsp:Transcript_14817/g.20666  ORF Transcript_14817/g.20666 Transcript_14817/m.20666 type:complete len:595 (-) Transcript_14817:42-1826(-)
MLDHFSIFTKGGIVLWSYNQAKLKGSPIDNLIRTVLLEERGNETSYNIDSYTIKWSFANEFELIFVVVYQKILQLLYIDELLEAVRKKFCDHYRETLEDVKIRTKQHLEFTDMFVKILESVESRSERQKKERAEKGPRKFEQTDKASKTKDDSSDKESASAKKEVSDKADSEDDSSNVQSNIEKLKAKGLGPRGKSSTKLPKKPAPTATSPAPPPKKSGRKWDDASASREELKRLDLSSSSQDNGQEPEIPIETGHTNLDWDVESDEDEPQEAEQNNNDAPKANSSGFFSMIKNLVSAKPLEKKDLDPVMAKFKGHLITKNVATEVAEKICDSVGASLQGKVPGSFESVKTIVLESMEEALVRILTPKKTIDILRDAMEAKKEGRPYVITFCGVNGVGKSTNLAKVGSLLLQNGFTVIMAAGDTFRSGAIQQLSVHAKRLGVEVYEKGYATDPTIVAQDAIRYAKSNNIDVVLVDTAGRMQGNDDLMRQLSKLVNTVKPDLVLFVGEALVGNDGVDQLVTFNESLSYLSTQKNPRLIDGIILTKFDTIDDKVGAAISMVYSTGIPIAFLGTGQHYTDLKRMNTLAVTKALLKGA